MKANKSNDTNKSLHIIFGFLFLLVAIGFIFIFDSFIIGNDIPSNLSNDQWITFLGSYLGGIIGGGATLIAVLISIRHTQAVQRSNNRLTLELHKEQVRLINENERNSIKPVLIIRRIHAYNEKDNQSVRMFIDIANIGKGTPCNGCITKVFIEGAYFVQIDENVIKYDKNVDIYRGDIYVEGIRTEDLKENKVLHFEFSFGNIYEDMYEQKNTVSFTSPEDISKVNMGYPKLVENDCEKHD